MDLLERVDGGVRHPWETARALHVVALLRQHELPAGCRLLDAGSGDSYVAAEIDARFHDVDITCWDINYLEEDLADSRPGLRRVVEPSAGPYDVFLALDVLEHIGDDGGFLRDLLSRATHESLLVVTVPAYQSLFSPHDLYLRHYRRYSRRQLTDALSKNGWSVMSSGGFFTSLLPIRVGQVLARRLRGESSATRDLESISSAPSHLGHWSRGPVTTSALHGALSLDAAVGRAAASRGLGLPGLSIFAVATPTRSKAVVA